MSNIIIYFSRSGNNYVNGEIKDLPIGNTEVAAKMIQELTGSNLFKLNTVVEYSTNYSQCIEEAKQDLRRDARPELKAYPESMSEYDTVYIGYPNYWGTMPMAVFTFLEKYDFTGKTIKPFCTHEGSGMGNSETDIKKLCPTAIVKKGIAIHGANVNASKNSLENWV